MAILHYIQRGYKAVTTQHSDACVRGDPKKREKGGERPCAREFLCESVSNAYTPHLNSLNAYVIPLTQILKTRMLLAHHYGSHASIYGGVHDTPISL